MATCTLRSLEAQFIVPGWTGTYWMKHVIAIDALTKPLGGFWMNPAYRIPVGKFPLRDRFITQENAATTPITEIVVNSLITSHRDGDKVKAGKVTVSGMAWDGGYPKGVAACYARASINLPLIHALAVQRPNESNPLGFCCDIVKPVFSTLLYDDGSCFIL